MFIAAGKIILDFYGNQSRPSKRREMEKLLEEVGKRFHISAVEVADFDDLERCVVGLALCGANEKSAREAMKKVLEHIDGNAFARVVVEDIDVFGYD